MVAKHSDRDQAACLVLGKQVRDIRRRQGRRLKDLAAEAGCSESLLSRLESGRVTPSLTTLHRVARALGVNVTELIDPPGDNTRVVHHPDERARTARGNAAEGDGSVAECLVPFAPMRRLEALIVTLPPGGALCGPFVHEGEEVGLVLSGELELTVEGKVFLVSAESSFFLQSHRPHAYRAVGDVECRVVWINTPPTF
jgi:transcriptional regulator with XRE-family HTH domain